MRSVDRYRRSAVLAVACAALGAAPAADARPHAEFQQHVRAFSGRNMDCAMCHAHPDGPAGPRAGQIGSLTPEQFALLSSARAAFEPGQDVESPILNDFGNHIIRTIGKTKFLALRQNPAALPDALGFESDLDDDGIADAQEYIDGTHPLSADSGDPWKLFVHNVGRSRFHLGMLLAATIFGLYGLRYLLLWFDAVARKSRDRPPLENTSATSRSEAA